VKVALYLRVSTTDQDPETQGREVRAFVASRGLEPMASVVQRARTLDSEGLELLSSCRGPSAREGAVHGA
jgi:DNA invertase Pin-like site-specific DNA recombinase